MTSIRRSAGVVAVVVTLAGIAGCSISAGSSDSRAKLYDTMEALARDSAVIVIGPVTGQRPDGDTTVSMVAVASAPSSPGLGENVATAAVAVGDAVEVRQDPASRPLLSVGAEYVLWLTPSMLPGDAADQFFITGSIAGAYMREGHIARRLDPASGDQLPDTVTISD
jgi:hypothetical protein